MAEQTGIILTIVALLTVIVNIITEVSKTTIPMLNNSKRINVFVLAISEVLTLASGIFYVQYYALEIEWYHIAIMIVLGFFVAFSAMFGYDKLLSYFEGVKNGKR